MATTTPEFEEFLEAHLGQEMLRFTTAGSVDDGKSTLIGRLLHDTKSVYEDQLASVKKSRVNRARGRLAEILSIENASDFGPDQETRAVVNSDLLTRRS